MSMPQPYLHNTNVNYYATGRHSLATFFPSEVAAIKRVIKPGIRVLDIGGNRGGLLNAMSEITSEIEYTCIDVNQSAIDAGRKDYPTQRFICGEFGSVDVPGKFDALFCFALFQHFRDWKNKLKEMAKLTDGAIVLDVTMTQGRSVIDPDVSYSYYYGSGERVPIIILNVFEFVNYCFTEFVGAGHVAVNLVHADTGAGMWGVGPGEGLRGCAIITKDKTGKPIFGGATPNANPDFMKTVGIESFRFPSVEITIDGKSVTHPFAAP